MIVPAKRPRKRAATKKRCKTAFSPFWRAYRVKRRARAAAKKPAIIDERGLASPARLPYSRRRSG
jgi:hypothetical protein